jgi:hypothetical protein
MDINDLPPEVLTMIFSYLTQLDLLTTINTVCHYWNKVAFSRSLWKTINITHSTDDDINIYLQNMAHYRDFVENLLIKSVNLIKLFDIRKNRNLSNLRSLQIPDYLYDKEARCICKNIVELYPGIVAIGITISNKTDIVSFLSVLSNLQLRDFDISMQVLRPWNIIALDKIICEFISKQCSLQSLRIEGSTLESRAFIKLLRNLNNLTCLSLRNSTTIDGSVFTASPELSKLTALHLSYTDVYDEGLKNIATKAPHLKTLTLNNCRKYSDIGIGYIADGCHCLEHLVIYDFHNYHSVRIFPSTLETIGKGCPKLKYLHMGICPVVDDSGIIALVQNCHDLEYLNLQSKTLSTPSLHAISHFCSNLFHLEISGYNFNAASVQSLLTKHRFIKYVSIGSCSSINAIDLCKSNEAKSGISETHSHVTMLKIDFVPGQRLTGYSAVEQIVTFCPDLRKLILYKTNPAIRNAAIAIAFGNCRFLETLILNRKTIKRPEFKTNLK